LICFDCLFTTISQSGRNERIAVGCTLPFCILLFVILAVLLSRCSVSRSLCIDLLCLLIFLILCFICLSCCCLETRSFILVLGIRITWRLFGILTVLLAIRCLLRRFDRIIRIDLLIILCMDIKVCCSLFGLMSGEFGIELSVRLRVFLILKLFAS
jgi:hypothetical protein